MDVKSNYNLRELKTSSMIIDIHKPNYNLKELETSSLIMDVHQITI
jgi:hypothetical protein